MTEPREALIHLIDVQGEALHITALEQPCQEACKHCGRGGFHRFRVTNFPNLLIDIAEAWARREWAKLKRI